MKKKNIILAGLLTVTTIVGCSSEKKELTQNQKIAQKVIEIANDYLDMNISADEALEKTEELDERIESAVDAQDEPCSSNSLGIYTTSLELEYGAANPSDDEVKNNRDKLAQTCKVEVKN